LSRVSRNDIKIISDACERSQTPTVVDHRSNNCIGFLVVAQEKLLGPDNKQSGGAPLALQDASVKRKIDGHVLDCGSVLPLFSSKIEDVICKKSGVR
jgi:hypothetical protein